MAPDGAAMPNRARTANAFLMRTPTSTPRAVDDQVALYVHASVPVGLSEARWPQVQELVVAQVLRLNVGLETMRRCIRALAYLTSWCVDQRIPIDVEHVLDPDTVERYCTERLRLSRRPDGAASARPETGTEAPVGGVPSVPPGAQAHDGASSRL